MSLELVLENFCIERVGSHWIISDSQLVNHFFVGSLGYLRRAKCKAVKYRLGHLFAWFIGQKCMGEVCPPCFCSQFVGIVAGHL